MFRLCSGHVVRLAASMALLSLSAQTLTAHAAGVPAAPAKPAVRSAAVAVKPMVGTVQRVERSTLLLLPAGSKRPTRIQLDSRTEYVVQGKHATRAPALRRGLLISVVATEANGALTAQIVTLAAGAPARAVAAATPGALAAALPHSVSLAGIVTLASVATVTLQTGARTATIKLTAATRYVVKGKTTSTRPVLHAGEKVQIVAQQTRGVLVGEVLTAS